MLLGATLLLTLVPLMLWFVLRGSALFKTSQQRKLQHIDRRLRQCGVFRLEDETLRQALKRANAASAGDLKTLSEAINAFELTHYAKDQRQSLTQVNKMDTGCPNDLKNML